MGDFRVLVAWDDLDVIEWKSRWAASYGKEPQAHPSNAVAMAAPGELPRCAVFDTPTGSVLFPFMLRRIPGDGSSLDAVTPYGYGGAYFSGSPDPTEFWMAWTAWAAREGVVSLLIRNSLDSESVLAPPGKNIPLLRNIVVPIGAGPEALWTGFEGRVRTAVRKASRLGVSVKMDAGCENVEGFHRIYTATMRSRGAGDFYMFSKDTLEELTRSMPDSVSLCHAYQDGELVASEMNLLGSRNAYYFLSGSTTKARQSGANVLMKCVAMDWLARRGVSSYVLGGGLKNDDSLYKYKRAYAPKSSKTFSVNYLEISSSRVREILNARRLREPDWNPSATFYPPYRA